MREGQGQAGRRSQGRWPGTLQARRTTAWRMQASAAAILARKAGARTAKGAVWSRAIDVSSAGQSGIARTLQSIALPERWDTQDQHD